VRFSGLSKKVFWSFFPVLWFFGDFEMVFEVIGYLVFIYGFRGLVIVFLLIFEVLWLRVIDISPKAKVFVGYRGFRVV
jgi:hypothetical protein